MIEAINHLGRLTYAATARSTLGHDPRCFERSLEPGKTSEPDCGCGQDLLKWVLKANDRAEDFDYVDLLLKYIDHVGTWEGTSFLRDGERSSEEINDAEWFELQRLNREGRG